MRTLALLVLLSGGQAENLPVRKLRKTRMGKMESSSSSKRDGKGKGGKGTSSSKMSSGKGTRSTGKGINFPGPIFGDLGEDVGLPIVSVTDVPSDMPSDVPSTGPSSAPSDLPSDVPSDAPSDTPSTAPSLSFSPMPSLLPTITFNILGEDDLIKDALTCKDGSIYHQLEDVELCFGAGECGQRIHCCLKELCLCGQPLLSYDDECVPFAP